MEEKMQTPEYILDIRSGKYSKTGAVMTILKECGISEFPINNRNLLKIIDCMFSSRIS